MKYVHLDKYDYRFGVDSKNNITEIILHGLERIDIANISTELVSCDDKIMLEGVKYKKTDIKSTNDADGHYIMFLSVNRVGESKV